MIVPAEFRNNISDGMREVSVCIPVVIISKIPDFVVYFGDVDHPVSGQIDHWVS
jgi:hypothetical protein